MESLVVLWFVLQGVIHLSCQMTELWHGLSMVAWLLLRVFICRSVGPIRLADSGELLRWTQSKVEVHICGLQQVVADLILVHDGPNHMGLDVFPAVVFLEFAPYSRPFAGLETFHAQIVALVVQLSVFHVAPDLDFDDASAVVDLVGDMRRLLGDVADLANQGDMVDFAVVQEELSIGVSWYRRVGLENGDRSDGILAIGCLAPSASGICDARPSYLASSLACTL